MVASPQALITLQSKFSSNSENASNLQDEVYGNLARLRGLVKIYNNSKSPETLQEIIQILDLIKSKLVPLSTTQRRELLCELSKKDKETWKQYRWEVVDYKDSQWHENNDSQAHHRVGITSDVVMQLAQQKKDPNEQLVSLILTMGYIYGLTRGILCKK